MSGEKNTEAQIIEAAKKIFLQKGLSGARMQDIADEAGINKAMLHYYFRSKEKLFEIIFNEAAEKILSAFNDILDKNMDFREMVTAIVESYIDNLREMPYLPIFVLNELNQSPDRIIKLFRPQGMRNVKAFMEVTAAAQQRGEIRKDIPPMHLLLNILSMCIFPFAARPMVQAIAGLSDQQFDQLTADRKKLVVSFALNALKP